MKGGLKKNKILYNLKELSNNNDDSKIVIKYFWCLRVVEISNAHAHAYKRWLINKRYEFPMVYECLYESRKKRGINLDIYAIVLFPFDRKKFVHSKKKKTTTTTLNMLKRVKRFEISKKAPIFPFHPFSPPFFYFWWPRINAFCTDLIIRMSVGFSRSHYFWTCYFTVLGKGKDVWSIWVGGISSLRSNPSIWKNPLSQNLLLCLPVVMCCGNLGAILLVLRAEIGLLLPGIKSRLVSTRNIRDPSGYSRWVIPLVCP